MDSRQHLGGRKQLAGRIRRPIQGEAKQLWQGKLSQLISKASRENDQPQARISENRRPAAKLRSRLCVYWLEQPTDECRRPAASHQPSSNWGEHTVRSRLPTAPLATLLTLLLLGSIAFPALAQRPPRRPGFPRDFGPPQGRSQFRRPPSNRPPSNRPPFKGSRDRQPDRLEEGDVAPDFTLKSPDGKRQVTLSDYRDKKPVALVFGSYT